MSSVLPAGLRPEGCAGAEHHVKMSLSHSQFGETEVGAENAARSCTTTLLYSEGELYPEHAWEREVVSGPAEVCRAGDAWGRLWML